MPGTHLHAVIFDFDLTLADSSAGVTACINHALTEMGFQAVPPQRARRTIGLSLRDTFASLTGITDSQAAERFSARFVEHADQVMEDLTHLFNGAPQTIQQLRQEGLALAIVSTKFRYRIQNILRRHALADQFELIIGGEDVPQHKPDPCGLLMAVERLGVNALEAVYAGDHTVDAETAQRAGLPFVAVLSGSCTRQDFNGQSVIFFVKTITEFGNRFSHIKTRIENQSR